MKDTSKFKITENYVANVKKTIGSKGLAKIAWAGGTVIQSYARINVNKNFSKYATGGAGLQESITVEIVKENTNNAVANIGATKIYGRIQELGGWIYPVFKRMLSWIDRETGKRVMALMVYIPPRPYLRPAVDEHKKEIKQAMDEQVFKLIRESTK